MSNSKMTEREIYNSILDGTFDTDVLVEFAEKKIAQLDKRNESAAKRAAKKRAESDDLMEKVAEFVTENPQSRDEITLAMQDAGIDVTVGKVTARLSKLVKAERISKAKAKVAGEDGKNHEVTVYALSF